MGVQYNMKYMGSKSRIAKYIVPILQDKIKEHKIETYIEPFVGGGNIINKIDCKNKIGSDNNEFLIEIFTHLDNIRNELPTPVVTYEHYDECRQAWKNNDFSTYPKWYIGAIGFLASYRGKFYDGGFCGKGYLEGKISRNYYDEARRNLVSQIDSLHGINFKYGDYEELYRGDVKHCLFYCDIPYANTTQYSTSKGFDYKRFWTWADRMSKNNIVIVSEYSALDNWKCIWEKPLVKTMGHNSNGYKIGVERLFEVKKVGENDDFSK